MKETHFTFRRCLAALIACLLTTAALAEQSKWAVQLQEVPLASLDTQSPDAVTITRLDALPDGQLLGVTIQGRAVLIDPRSPKQLPRSLSSIGWPEVLRPTAIGSNAETLALINPATQRLMVFDSQLKRRARLSVLQANPHIGIAFAGDKLFGLGLFAEGRYDPETHGDQRDWFRQALREDCTLFVIDLSEPDSEARPVICDDSLADGNERATLGQGDIIASTDQTRIYAVLERRPSLYVVSSDGALIAESSYLREGEGFEPYRASDSARKLEPGFYYELRSRYRWVQGLVLGPRRTVGIVFRTFDGTTSRFSLDLFSRDGEKLAEDLPLPLPEGGRQAQVIPVDVPSGRQYLFLTEPNEQFDAADAQKLYRLDIRQIEE